MELLLPVAFAFLSYMAWANRTTGGPAADAGGGTGYDSARPEGMLLPPPPFGAQPKPRGWAPTLTAARSTIKSALTVDRSALFRSSDHILSYGTERQHSGSGISIAAYRSLVHPSLCPA